MRSTESTPTTLLIATSLLFGMSTAAKGITYDYAIAGGGTAGLLLAVALSADPSVTVAVLEAGGDARADPRVTVPEKHGSIAGSIYDWNLTTVPQVGITGNKGLALAHGKTLGGTSAMNWMLWMRQSQVEWDAWSGVLGLAGWNWSTMYEAAKASETFTNPAANVSSIPGLSYDDAYHGDGGPVAGTMAKDVFSFYPEYLVPALKALGVPLLVDRDGGNTTGVGSVPLAINASTNTRSYSGSAYTAVQSRPNLHVLTNAQATRILWKAQKNSAGQAVASGLAYINPTSGSTTSTALNASNIILSAGAILTPPLLEASGIGDPAILTPLNITPVVALPAVGQNLADHPTFAGLFTLNESAPTFTGAAPAQNFLDYAQPSRFLSPSDHAAVTVALTPTKPPPGSNIAQPTWTMLRHLFTADAPFIEYGWFNQFVTAYLLHPFSAGSVHLNSTTPPSGEGKIRIDPGYNTATLTLTLSGTRSTVPIDAWLLAKAAQYYATALPASAPLASLGLNYTTIPSAATAPFSSFLTAVEKGMAPGAHFSGGANMLPRARGGVVDAELKVYGTGNVRVVDASVLPTVPGGHPMGCIYAVAMRAAELFRGS